MRLPYELSLADAAEAIAARELSPVELTDSVLERIAEVEGDLGAYVTVSADEARKAATQAEQDIAAGRHRGPLHGIPMTLKDLIDAAGLPTTASSRVRAHHTALKDSAVAARLRSAGAVLLGKTHTHEFAYGLTTPQTRNAWAADRVAGGSSGGSAVAVAAGAATFALGTDTGGSIRVPSALNGVVGLKPTYGLVPVDGVTPLSWSLDHVGPITRTARDAELVLAALTGQHPTEEPSRTHESLAGLRVAVPRNYYFDRVAPEVAAAVHRAIGQLAALGAELTEVDIPMTEYVQATQWGVMVPEATASHEQTLRTSPELYGPDVRVLLEAGGLVPATDYLRAQRARALMQRAWARLFEEADLIAAPTVPCTAVHRDQQEVSWPATGGPGSQPGADAREGLPGPEARPGTPGPYVSESVSDAYVRLSAPANLTGLPSLSLPVGLDGAGLPIGMQLIGRAFGEATLLRAGRAYETAHPPVTLFGRTVGRRTTASAPTPVSEPTPPADATILR
ncbi:amidase [Streptomyces sp. NRRL S-1448]|uniref:amidase n=1 Tax=Streptomyces sp. NRRL S-1448 TaxID=1463883 RepID=UPI0007C44D99|nr:amidase [Streptomyces sp. NRRL S-1448]